MQDLRTLKHSLLSSVPGVALLREETPKSPVSDEFPAAPASLLLEATRLHPYAVAAYTVSYVMT